MSLDHLKDNKKCTLQLTIFTCFQIKLNAYTQSCYDSFVCSIRFIIVTKSMSLPISNNLDSISNDYIRAVNVYYHFARDILIDYKIDSVGTDSGKNFLYAHGGSGKTFPLKNFFTKLRSRERITI